MIRNILVSELKPRVKLEAGWNPDYRRLYKSIYVAGVFTPLTVSSRLIIVDGYWRYVIARELNIKELPCHVVPLFDDQIEIYDTLTSRRQ